LCAQFPRVEGVPYFISSIQTAGDQANIHLTGLAKMRDQERRDLEQSLETCADEGEAERMRRRLAEIGERER
ncbi:MAG: hypothetical protein JXP34_15130, partial [Planctomycetes bacterium]|nr:hypothetical protein [Planctomycetota bacterium]